MLNLDSPECQSTEFLSLGAFYPLVKVLESLPLRLAGFAIYGFIFHSDQPVRGTPQSCRNHSGICFHTTFPRHPLLKQKTKRVNFIHSCSKTYLLICFHSMCDTGVRIYELPPVAEFLSFSLSVKLTKKQFSEPQNLAQGFKPHHPLMHFLLSQTTVLLTVRDSMREIKTSALIVCRASYLIQHWTHLDDKRCKSFKL